MAANPFALPDNAARYLPGTENPLLTTTLIAVPLPPGTYKRLRTQVEVNTVDKASTLRFVKNGVLVVGGPQVVIGAGITGSFDDLLASLIVTEGDRITCALELDATAAPASTMTLTVILEKFGGGVVKFSSVVSQAVA